jgi:hypothetical protein
MSPSTDSRENREFGAELKFLVSPALAAQIQGWARGRLLPDPNAGGPGGDTYRITSLYFDTAQSDVYHRRGSFGRSKYRIRRYGESESVFLERKLRTRGLLAKRRSIVALAELPRLAGLHAESGWPGFWFHRRLLARRLRPVCQIAYDRTARVALTPNGPIRLTLDRNLRGLPAAGRWFQEQAGWPLLPDQVIVELKFRRETPTLFKYLVAEFALNAQPFSKYRLAAARLGLVPEPTLVARSEAIPAYA